MNIKPFSIQLSILFIAATLSFASCRETEVKPEDKPQNETELITTMTLIFTDSATNQISTFSFKDTDGDGGSGPVQFDTIQLAANKTYTCKVLLLDESKTETDTISNEVLKESDDHLFIYTISGLNLAIFRTDKDANNLPLGLNSKWWTGNMSNGKVKITLKHQPGVKDGSATPGETDAEVEFICKIN